MSSSLFSSRGSGGAAEFAHLQNSASGKLLTVRISLQQVIDECNKFPVLESAGGSGGGAPSLCLEDSNPLRDGLYGVLGELVETLEQQVSPSEEEGSVSGASGKKRRRASFDASGGASKKLTWEQVLQPQKRLQRDWETVINREHARSHFGSELKKSRLKVFNNSLWDQIDDILTDQNRVIEKSRVPLAESERKHVGEDKTIPVTNSKSEDDEYDLEVYNDRHFYSQLLKSFISSSTSGIPSRHGGDSSMTPDSMRPEDFAALKKYKKSKSKVDRKASKGRKIRYVPHEKLRNFMFPIPYAESAIDVDHLFCSLFQ